MPYKPEEVMNSDYVPKLSPDFINYLSKNIIKKTGLIK